MQRFGECISVANIEFVIVDVMQEHIDAAKVVGGDVNFLPEKSVAHVFPAQNFGKFQQQRAAAASRVIHLVHLRPADDGQTGQQLGNLLRSVVFAAGFPGVARIHPHQKLVGITESVNRVGAVVTEFHLAHAIQQLDEPLVALRHRGAKFGAVHIDIIKQPFEVVFRARSLCGGFNVFEYCLQFFVEVVFCPCPVTLHFYADIFKQLARQNEKALGGNQILARLFGINI